MGEAQIRKATEEEAASAKQQATQPNEQQSAWANQQVQAVFVNGFSLMDLGGMVRISFNEQTRADLPGSVRASLLMHPQAARSAAALLMKFLDSMETNMVQTSVPNGELKN
jgi:hypothetical protein